MSNIVDRVFAEVCLDERVSGGIFKMEEEAHMDALRDYFVKKGITKEDATSLTNRMVESLNYPERQAYRKEDGIKVTWPSAKHMANAMKENPGKYVGEEEAKRLGFVKDKVKPRPEPDREPEKKPVPSPEKEIPDENPDDEKSLPRSSAGNNLFGGDKVDQGGKELAIEPPRGAEKPEPIAPEPTVAPPVPRTPERVAAEKEVVKQIFGTSNNSLSNIEPPLNEYGNPEVENKIKIMRSTLVSLIDSLTFEQLSEAYSLLVTKYMKP